MQETVNFFGTELQTSAFALIFGPPLAYWISSIFWLVFELSFPQYAAAHELNFKVVKKGEMETNYSEEEKEKVLSRSPSKLRVVVQVFIQQLIQVIVTLMVAEQEPPATAWDLQFGIGMSVFRIIVGAIVYDSWQYWIHRYMHINTFLYRHLHSTHHKIILPYSFSALYNHPLEAFLLDTIGGAVTMLLVGLSNWEATILFSIAMVKTVDDHCGYQVPWNPLQQIFTNNARYHYVHHQIPGIKTNFSQPFFSFWDFLCGTENSQYLLVPKKQV
jgi:sphinganine C4-monooxygenase